MRYANEWHVDRCPGGDVNYESGRIEVALETLFESVDRAEEISLRAAQSCGFGEDDCQKICLAVREGVVNAIRYGNQQQRDKKIVLTCALCGDKFVVHILDQGCGFDLADVPDPLAEENLLKTSGRGIFLMRTFMDEFAVFRPSGGGAELVMAKHLRTSSKKASGTQNG
jgi:serine/threonine-protein kinase RsbW